MLDAYIIDKIKEEKQVSDAPQPEIEIQSHMDLDPPAPKETAKSEKRGIAVIDFTI